MESEKTGSVLVVMGRGSGGKTRLIPAVGEEGAGELGWAFLQDVCGVARGGRWRCVLAVAGEEERVRGLGMEVVGQGEGELGERLERVIGREIDGGAERVCVIGSDSPLIEGGMIERAFRALEGVEVVVGPAEDGGYWLIGVKGREGELFRGVPWGTGGVMAATMARLEGRSYALVEEFWDVDEPGDLERLARELAAAPPSVARATRAAMARFCGMVARS